MSVAHDHAILARACVTRAIKELQEAVARCTQGNEADLAAVLPASDLRHAERYAADALDRLNIEIARGL